MSALQPKKLKYGKSFRPKGEGTEGRVNELVFGSFGLKAIESKWVTSKQVEAARRAILRYLRKGGKLWLRIFPQIPITKKSEGAPMGGGKGDVKDYVFPVKSGRILFEIGGVDENTAKEALRIASHKLPLKTKFVKK